MQRRALRTTLMLVVCTVMIVAPAAAVKITNAAVDLDSVPPTVTFLSLDDDFGGLQGSVFQVVAGDPVALVVVSWSTESVTAELAESTPGDYMMAVVPISEPKDLFPLTIGSTTAQLADPPCFDNDNRYVDCGNGTVTDTSTGLVWLQDADCFGELTYSGANAAAAALQDGDCGLTDKSKPGDWRLATIDEWTKSVAEADRMTCAPCVTNDPVSGCLSDGPTSFFNVRSENYWSSTGGENQGTEALFQVLTNCNLGAGDKLFEAFVWPVRD